MPALVECRSDYTYAQRPTALQWEGRRLEVAEVLAAWRTPAGPGFRVRAAQGQTFELRYVEAIDEWQVQLVGAADSG
jgi:hypothetical protein